MLSKAATPTRARMYANYKTRLGETAAKLDLRSFAKEPRGYESTNTSTNFYVKCEVESNGVFAKKKYRKSPKSIQREERITRACLGGLNDLI